MLFSESSELQKSPSSRLSKMFLAVSFLLLGMGMVSSSPVRQSQELNCSFEGDNNLPEEPTNPLWIPKEPQCKEITDSSITCLKHKYNTYYICKCIEGWVYCTKEDVSI